MSQMTPVQLLQYAILEVVYEYDDNKLESIPNNLTGEEIDELWDDLYDDLGAIDTIRTNGTSTGLEAEYCRHYESEAVAVQAPNGQWVGFTYWFGGGKHGEPEAIEWIDKAYHVHCKEYEKLVTIQEFKKA